MCLMEQLTPENVVRQGLATTRVMSLATLHKNAPRVVMVHFVHSADLTRLYWLSEPNRIHSKDLAADPRASAGFTIRDTPGVIGLTVQGTARVITECGRCTRCHGPLHSQVWQRH